MAEIIKEFLYTHVPNRDAQDVEEKFLRKSIVMSKRPPAPKKRRLRLRKGTLTAATRRQLGFNKLQKTGLRYSECVPMNDLWQQYMNTYLGLEQLLQRGFCADPADPRTDSVMVQLCRADFHGALVRVLRSRCSSLEGAAGLVLLETRGTFQIVTPDDKLKMIPKQHSVLETSVRGFRIRLFGNNLLSRPAARGMKKLKAKKTIEL